MFGSNASRETCGRRVRTNEKRGSRVIAILEPRSQEGVEWKKIETRMDRYNGYKRTTYV